MELKNHKLKQTMIKKWPVTNKRINGEIAKYPWVYNEIE